MASTDFVPRSDDAPGPELDAVDVALLDVLVANGRIANNALAAQVGIAPSCVARVRSLRERGVIRGCTRMSTSGPSGGHCKRWSRSGCRPDARSRIDAFQAYLAGLPGVLNVFCLSRADDFQVHVAVQTPDRLRDFVVDHLSASADVTMTETSLIFENVGA